MWSRSSRYSFSGCIFKTCPASFYFMGSILIRRNIYTIIFFAWLGPVCLSWASFFYFILYHNFQAAYKMRNCKSDDVYSAKQNEKLFCSWHKVSISYCLVWHLHSHCTQRQFLMVDLIQMLTFAFLFRTLYIANFAHSHFTFIRPLIFKFILIIYRVSLIISSVHWIGWSEPYLVWPG